MNSGIIMWISQRDGNGIILVDGKHEVYFDSSVTPNFADLKRKDTVNFILNAKITDCLCAKDVMKDSITVK